MVSQVSSSLFTVRTSANSSMTSVQKIASSIFSLFRIPCLSRINFGRVALGLGGTALLAIGVISAVEYFFPSVLRGADGVPPVRIDHAHREELPPAPQRPPAPNAEEVLDPDREDSDEARASDADVASWIRIGTPRIPLETPRPGAQDPSF